MIDPNSFGIYADEGPKSSCDLGLPDCRYPCPSGSFCEVPFDAVLCNGAVGDYRPPLTMSLNASDPNGDGTVSCSPWSASVSVPIVVRAEVSDGVTTVSSEVRRFIMLDRVG